MSFKLSIVETYELVCELKTIHTAEFKELRIEFISDIDKRENENFRFEGKVTSENLESESTLNDNTYTAGLCFQRVSIRKIKGYN